MVKAVVPAACLQRPLLASHLHACQAPACYLVPPCYHYSCHHADGGARPLPHFPEVTALSVLPVQVNRILFKHGKGPCASDCTASCDGSRFVALSCVQLCAQTYMHANI